MKSYKLKPTDSLCPICNHREGLILYAVDASQAAQHYVLKEVHPDRHAALRHHIERLWEQPTCQVVQCSHCGFCFADPYVAGDAEFYALAYERNGYPKWRWEFDRTRDRIQHLVSMNEMDPNLLEIGAGDGAFIKNIVPSSIPKENVLCTEYSDYGKEKIEQYGVKCVSEDVRALSLERRAGRFDFICMFQVLEHLDRLDELFSRLTELAKERAHLFIAVPNDRRVEFNELHGSLLDLPPNHVGRWNRTSFETVAQLYGWQLTEHEIEPDSAAGKAMKHAVYRYMCERQNPNSVANRIERWPSSRSRRPLQAIAAGMYGLQSLGAIAAMIRTEGLGGSQWAHLERASTTGL